MQVRLISLLLVSTDIQQWILMNSIITILIHFQKNQPKKTVFLLRDFNVDLLKYEDHKATNEFLDSLSSNKVLPYISSQLELPPIQSLLLIILFSNYISQEIISGNLTLTISDHLPQFLIPPHIFSNAPNKKYDISERDCSKFNREEFILEYFAIDWPHSLKIQNNDTNTSFESFF